MKGILLRAVLAGPTAPQFAARGICVANQVRMRRLPSMVDHGNGHARAHGRGPGVAEVDVDRRVLAVETIVGVRIQMPEAARQRVRVLLVVAATHLREAGKPGIAFRQQLGAFRQWRVEVRHSAVDARFRRERVGQL